MRRIFATVAATCVLAAGLSAPSAAIPALEDLPRRADTVVPHLVLSDPPVIESPGASFPLPAEVTDGHSGFKLVGRTDLGWLVAAQNFDNIDGEMTSDSLHLVTATDSTELFALDGVFLDQQVHYRLSTSRTRVIRWNTGNEAFDFTIFNLSGNVVAHRPLVSDAWVWDFTGTRVVYDGGASATWSWTIGQPPRKITDRTVKFADIGRNTLVVVRGDESTPGARNYKAFATLTHPNRFRWQAHFLPSIISPDGRRVAGWSDRNEPIIQVRRMSDGKLLTSLYVANVGAAREDRLRWEGNAAVVFQGNYENGDAVLVRCTLTKVCARVSDRAPSFYFPHRPGSYGY